MCPDLFSQTQFSALTLEQSEICEAFSQRAEGTTTAGLHLPSALIPSTANVLVMQKRLKNNPAVVSSQAVFSMRNRQRGSHLGLLLLASQLFQVGLDNIPPVTLAVLGLNVYLYLFPAAPLNRVMH